MPSVLEYDSGIVKFGRLGSRDFPHRSSCTARAARPTRIPDVNNNNIPQLSTKRDFLCHLYRRTVENWSRAIYVVYTYVICIDTRG